MATDIVSPLESTIEQHLDSTSRLVRRVDLALSLFIVLSLILGGLFLAILADHWLKDGLSMPLRFGVFFTLCIIAGVYIRRKILPHFQYQINPVYTAHLIEKDTPAFKNSLINWLLLRHEREERQDNPSDKVGKRMYDGIVQTAATNVQTVPADHPVDFRNLIRSGTFFMILLTLFVGYAVLSPKSPFASLARVLIPFGGIDRPQSTQFKNIKPGNATALQGETLTISSEVVSQSLDPVYLVFSTDDGQAVEQRIPMLQPEGKIAFETLFPPGKQGTQRGFNSSVDYWIAQGESRSPEFRIKVLPTASIEIASLQYKFPEYTGLPTETVEHTGDVRAIEGTEVSVSVRSTLPLQKIDLVFDDQPLGKVPMKISGEQKTEAKGTFTLKVPFRYKTFAFEATDENGNVSRRSGIYQIEAVPDKPPRVQWADTETHLKEGRIDLPINQKLPLSVQAEDPDFALRYLQFYAEAPGNENKKLPPEKLLDSPTQSGPTEHKGQITKSFDFSPEKFVVGDSVEVWVEATDTKFPADEDHTVPTKRLTINIVSPEEKEQKKDPNQENEQDGKEENSEQDGEQQPKEGDQGEQQEGTQNSPEQNEQQKNEGDQQQNESKEGEGEQPNEENNKENQPQEQNQQEGKPNEQQSKAGNENQEGNKAEGAGQQGEQNQAGQNQEGASGSGEQQDPKNDEEGSSQGAAGDEPSEGEEQSEQKKNDQTAGGQQSNEPANPNDAAQQGEGTSDSGQRTTNNASSPSNTSAKGKGTENASSSKGESKNSSSSPSSETPVNPETQDGDAMERIVEQMKKENKFDEKNVTEGKQQAAANDDQKSGKTEGQQGKQPANGGQQSAAENAERMNSPLSGMNEQLKNDNKNIMQDSSSGTESSMQGQSMQEKSMQEQKSGEKSASGTEGGENEQPGGKSGEESASGSEGQENKNSEIEKQGGSEGEKGDSGAEQGQAEQNSESASDQRSNSSSEGEKTGATPSEGQQTNGQQGQESQKGEAGQEGQTNPDPQNPNQSSGGQGSPKAAGTGGGSGMETETVAEDPNLEYAANVTNLVLEYLEDQLKEKPSDELLNKLGWTEDQLRQFYDKWQKMSEENQSREKTEGKNPWEEALKSLGMKPNRNRTALQQNQTTSKDKGRVIEAQRFESPPGIREQYKRFTEGIGR